MIPISLQLNNFLSYSDGAEPLDFTRFHTACLSGNNGNGKSALLDALTWAMWGEARHSTPNLLRIGAGDMRVEFVFDLDGERYRIVRGYTKRKRSGDSLLELNVRDAASNLYRSLTCPSVRETQERVTQLLRMDYETFIASAYLKQGMADRFSRQPPGQRKQVLAEILGLSRYQEIADRARADARISDAKVGQLEAQIDTIERFLAERDEAQTLFDHYTKLLSTLRPRIEEIEVQLGDLRGRKVRLEADRKRSEAIAREVQTLEREMRELRDARGPLLAKKAGIDQWLAQSDVIAADLQEFRDAKKKFEELQAVYERWRELADEAQRVKDRITEAGRVLHMSKASLEAQRNHDLATIATHEEQTAQATEIRAHFEQLQAARQEENEYSQGRAAYDTAQRELNEAREALRARTTAIESRLHSLEAQIVEAQSVAARAGEIQSRVQAAAAQVEKLDTANATLNELQEERNTHDARLAQLKQMVEAEKSGIEASRQKLRVLQANPQAQCPLCESQLGEHGREHIQENIEDEIALAESRIEDYTQEARLLRNKIAALDAPLAEHKKLLEQAPRLHQNHAVARSQYNEVEAAQIRIATLGKERDELIRQRQSGDFAPEESARMAQAERHLQSINYDPAAHAAASRRMLQLQPYESAMNTLEFAEKQIAQAQERLDRSAPQLRELQEQIESGSYAAEDTTTYERLKAQAARLGYDKDAKAQRQAADETIRRLGRAEERWYQYQNALRNLPETESNLEQNTKTLSVREQQLAALGEEAESLRDVTVKMAACERDIGEANRVLEEQRREERDAGTELGRQANKLEMCAQQEEERSALDEQRKSAARESLVLKHTATAFGKEGIQALIIENAIPEIQEYANEILRRLTRNNMQISLESQREKQSGGLKETLDIKISDDRGTREYSLFSGGEAFRADFALRIALSKLLARRAGTQLRTLIVDEGFGTQDADGLQQMIECIQAISEDFDKVLVVTHLDAIKNAFPVRIEVTKNPDTGSRYEILS
ncbi:MAG TPA: AAA family ATPase [Abditibacteriaceae bacterium]